MKTSVLLGSMRNVVAQEEIQKHGVSLRDMLISLIPSVHAAKCVVTVTASPVTVTVSSTSASATSASTRATSVVASTSAVASSTIQTSAATTTVIQTTAASTSVAQTTVMQTSSTPTATSSTGATNTPLPPDTVIATANGDFSSSKCTSAECPLGDLFTDCLNSQLGTDIAFAASGDFRKFWPNGKQITVQDVQQMFLDTVDVFTWTGRQLKQELEYLATPTKLLGKNILQWGGLRFVMDPNAPQGNRVTVTVNRKPLDLEKTYNIASTSYHVEKESDILINPDLRPFANVVQKGPSSAIALQCFLKFGATLNAVTDGRISVLPVATTTATSTVAPTTVATTTVVTFTPVPTKPAGVLTIALGTFTDCKTPGECATGNLVAGCLNSEQATDFSFINSGGVRGGFTDGQQIVRGDIDKVLPFKDTVTSFQWTGAQILSQLEYWAAGGSDAKKIKAFPQVSGVRFEIYTAQPVGQRVKNVLINNIALDANKTYRITTTDYIIGGGDGLLSGVTGPTAPGGIYADTFATCLSKLPSTSPIIDGRVKIIQ
ncbi:5'-nucleotidase [Gorgonomyces haynaldii]|nr:5'-nucleotidase [Gorgonomyces haynaldii]